MPKLPTFDSVEEERLHRKQRLAAAFRLFGQFGFDEGVAGHITARDPELTDHFWVNPFGMNFRQIRVERPHARRPQGRRRRGQLARQPRRLLHPLRRSTQARPDAVAAAHSHSIYGKAFSACWHRDSTPITQDACAFYDDHALFEDYTGVVLDLEEGKRIAHALGEHKAVILANHGLLTVGQSVDEAAWWFITMERTCQAQLLAMAAGTPKCSTTRPRNSPTARWGWRPPDGSSFSLYTSASSQPNPTCSTDTTGRATDGANRAGDHHSSPRGPGQIRPGRLSTPGLDLLERETNVRSTDLE